MIKIFNGQVSLSDKINQAEQINSLHGQVLTAFAASAGDYIKTRWTRSAVSIFVTNDDTMAKSVLSVGATLYKVSGLSVPAGRRRHSLAFALILNAVELTQLA